MASCGLPGSAMLDGWVAEGQSWFECPWARTAQRAGGHPPPPQQLRSHQQHHSHPLRQGWAAAGARRGWATAAAAAGSRTRPLGARPHPRWSSWRRPPTSLPRTATSAAAVTMTCESLACVQLHVFPHHLPRTHTTTNTPLPPPTHPVAPATLLLAVAELHSAAWWSAGAPAAAHCLPRACCGWPSVAAPPLRGRGARRAGALTLAHLPSLVARAGSSAPPPTSLASERGWEERELSQREGERARLEKHTAWLTHGGPPAGRAHGSEGGLPRRLCSVQERCRQHPRLPLVFRQPCCNHKHRAWKPSLAGTWPSAAWSTSACWAPQHGPWMRNQALLVLFLASSFCSATACAAGSGWRSRGRRWWSWPAPGGLASGGWGRMHTTPPTTWPQVRRCEIL